MSDTISQYLEDLERRINPEVEDHVLAQWKGFWNRSVAEGYFAPTRVPAPSTLEWPKININDAILDRSFELMLLRELCGVNAVLSGGSGVTMQIRTNFGTTILPSLFGVEVMLMDRGMDTLPGAHPLPGGAAAIERLLTAGVPPHRAGQGAAVFDCAQFYLETLAHYPKLQKYCRIYHPDAQGSLDICEVVWGSDLFLALHDTPDLVKRFLGLITDTYISFIDRWFELVRPKDDFNVHYGWIHPGKVRLSLDSCMNVSPDAYQEFVRPCDERLLNRYGGIVHSCGKVDHFVPLLAGIKGYHAFNLSQPHYNDMETIYRNTVDKGVFILGLDRGTADRAVTEGRKLHGMVMCS